MKGAVIAGSAEKAPGPAGAREGRCPRCGKAFRFEKVADHPAYPFCSKRCRDVDLGNWFSENYVIPSKAPPPPDPEGADDLEGLDAT